MTVSTITSRVVYLGNGSTTDFPFAFRIDRPDDLAVVLTDADGTDVALSPAQYAASGFGLEAGGSVTYPMSGEPLAPGARLTLARLLAATQPTQLANQGALWPAVIETALDRIVMVVQGFIDTLNRSLRITPTDGETLNALPAAAERANSGLLFDSEGQPYCGVLDAAAVAWSTWILNNLRSAASAAAARLALGAAGTGGDETIAGNKTITGDTAFSGANSHSGDETFSGTLTMSGRPINEARGADIASAATVDLTTATGNVVDVTGTTAITAVTLAEGAERTVRFTGALTLTHGASLVLPGGASIATAAGDYAILRAYAGGVVRCVVYSKADGQPVGGANVNADVVAMCKAAGTTRVKQFNVASVVKNSTGNFTFNFASPIDADAVIGAVAWSNGGSSGDCVVAAQSAGAVTIVTYDAAGTPQDYNAIHFVAHA